MRDEAPVLITGGAGFIGVALAEALLAQGRPVRLFDLEFDENAYRWFAPSGQLEVVAGDICDPKAVAQVCRDVRAVVHLAAVVGVRQVVARPLETLRVNLLGTQHLLEAVPVQIERFVYVSTSEVYGAQALNVRETDPCVVGPPDDPRWSYAASKIAGEQLVQAYHRQSGLRTAIVRPFNVFGPRQVRAGAALRFIQQAVAGEPITVYGDGSSVRAWCYIDDLVDGLLRVLERQEAVGQVFNIGNPRNAVSTYRLACEVARICESSSPIVFQPVDHSDVQARIPNVERAWRLLGYRPQVDLEEGLRRTYRWYLQLRDRSSAQGKR